MKSARPKVIHPVAGVPLIEYVLTTASSLAAQTITVVLGRQADDVRAALSHYAGVTFVVQEPQQGTAHALLTAEPALSGRRGTAILLYGDVPLLSSQTVSNLLKHHGARGAAAPVPTAVVDQPYGYGRIVRSGEQIARIVEERDASPAEQKIREINSGIYAFELDGLFDALRAVAAENAQGEY